MTLREWLRLVVACVLGLSAIVCLGISVGLVIGGIWQIGLPVAALGLGAALLGDRIIKPLDERDETSR